MSEISGLDFSHQDVLKALLKSADIHEGIWSLGVKFGITGVNIQLPGSPNVDPAAIVNLANLRIEKATELGPLTADAAVVNPRSAKIPKKASAAK